MPSFDSETSLKILTLNCYLLPPFPILNYLPWVPENQNPRDSLKRLNDICDNILANDYDIVCLQEVWMEEHKNEIVAQLNMKYSFYAWFPSGFLPGSGLLTLSKHKIVSSFFHRFLLEDKVFPFGSIDSICGKGSAVSLIDYKGFMISVINTHPQCETLTDSKNEIRLVQLWDIAQLANYCSRNSDVIILCGDFNARPSFEGMQLLRHIAGVRDCHSTALGNCTEDFVPNKDTNGVTYARQDNNLVERGYFNFYPNGARIDYILYSAGRDGDRKADWKNTSGSVSQLKCDWTRTRPWGLLGSQSRMPFSDHEGVDAQLSWVTETVAENGSGDIKKKSQLANDEKSAINNHGKGLLETSAKTFAILAAKAIAKKKIQLMFAIMSSITAVMVLLLQLMCLFNLIEFENPSRLMGFLGLSQTTLIVSFGCSFYLFYFYKCAASAYLQAHHSLKHLSF
ncbi:sphingomyelin phosphodiesterase 2-like [Symsagittifera roscoffensis]|uniref:sphingomyelin phosphodiesterase 2-like n=1 Tax=Symsagittifera roscoffensis TaxID=84072 RepID=UPI00307B1456